MDEYDVGTHVRARIVWCQPVLTHVYGVGARVRVLISLEQNVCVF